MSNYQQEKSGRSYIEYVNSLNGQTEREILWQAFSEQLAKVPKTPNLKILDAACGTGWLAGKVAEREISIQAFDSSEPLISYAKKTYPQVEFKVADITETLPYNKESFDAILFCMSGHDIPKLDSAFANMHSLLKPGGLLLMAVANPYYSFPVAVWKRGLIGWLLGQKPKLKLRPYNLLRGSTASDFTWNQSFDSHFHALGKYFEAALKAGFSLKSYHDLKSKTDSTKFDKHYQLYRFPTMVFLTFQK